MKIGEIVGLGRTATVYRWGKHEVLKVFYDPQHAINEAKNAEVIQSLGLPTPYYSGSIEYEGKQCLVYERIEGISMLQKIEQTAESISHNARLMARLQFMIHSVKVKYEPNLKDFMRKQISQLNEITEREKQIVNKNLSSLTEGQEVCHYDFHPDNIMISAKGPVVIDWMNVLIGNRKADAARSSMMMESNELPPRAPDWLKNRKLRIMFHHDYITEYCRLSETEQGEIDQWKIPTLAVRINEMRGQEQKETIERLRKAMQGQ